MSANKNIGRYDADDEIPDEIPAADIVYQPQQRDIPYAVPVSIEDTIIRSISNMPWCVIVLWVALTILLTILWGVWMNERFSPTYICFWEYAEK